MNTTARAAFEDSRRCFKEAIKAGTMDARDERHASWTPLLLDQIGWETVIAGIEGLARHVADEQVGARTRMALSGEGPVFASVVLAAFESPLRACPQSPAAGDRWGDPTAGLPVAGGEEPHTALRRARALAGPVRLGILAQASVEDLSPASFMERDGGGTPEEVARHFEALRKHGWLKLAESGDPQRCPDPCERVYRMNRAPILDTDIWSALPGSMKAVASAGIFQTYCWRVDEAMEAGTLDARDGWHFSTRTVAVDQLGWQKMIARTDTLFWFLFAEQARAKARLDRYGEQPFLATVALAAFESPGGARPKPRDLSHLA